MSAAPSTLVDTSAWVEYLRDGGHPPTQSAVRAALDSGRAALCDLIRLELWNGARGENQPRILRVLESTLETLPTTGDVWERARRLARRCRAEGLTLPATDLLIASCAEAHGAELVHCDAHLDRLEELRSEPGEGGEAGWQPVVQVDPRQGRSFRRGGGSFALLVDREDVARTTAAWTTPAARRAAPGEGPSQGGFRVRRGAGDGRGRRIRSAAVWWDSSEAVGRRLPESTMR